MPQPLRPTDSFNSSTATIVPDKKRLDRFYPQNSSRSLVSSNSLEGHINSALRVNAGGDDGMIGLLHTQTEDMGGNSLSGLSFMREFINIPPDDSQQSNTTSSRASPAPPVNGSVNSLGHLNFNPLPNNNQNFQPSPHSTFEPLQSPSPFEPIPSPNPSVHSNPFSTLTSPVNPSPEYPFRPSSVNSHHSHHSAAASSVDASEYYSTTDMDTDDDLSSIHDPPQLAINSNIGDLGMADMDLTGKPAIMTWTPYQPSQITSPDQHIQNQAVSPNEINQSTSTRTMRTGNHQNQVTQSKGRRSSIRSSVGITEDEKIKADKLEHRRDINRRSAQKHRLQRKKDMETMTQLLAERDAQIHQLQRDLEVEKARNDQLRVLMNTRLAGGSGTNVHM